jgi:hypothetical protein
MRAHSLRIVVAALALCAFDALAAQRTFVHSPPLGNDANAASNCSLANPCRSFNIAIGVTDPDGEVVILDTAGYGKMTIGKAIKVIGPSGVYGGISVFSGDDGVTINAGASDVVTLRGLDISGLGGVNGVNIVTAGVVHIEKTSIGNFTQDTSSCIRLDTAAAVQVFVVDSFLRECRNGVAVNGTGPDNSTRPFVEIDNTRIERALNTVAAGTTGLRLTGNFLANLRNSIIAYNGDGVFASNSIATAASRATIINSEITQSGNAAIETAGGNNGNLHVSVSNSVLNNNAAAILLGHGAITLASNAITNNTNTIVNCGGNVANVASLGYSGSVGSNLIAAFQNTTLPPGCTAFITPVIIVAQ